ncbi:MAG: peptidylprolyl isomerase [Pyrinomonadaceae bacterium]|nr:peptidylprolyl isomerase [Pyrinomonadaceae bacterium]
MVSSRLHFALSALMLAALLTISSSSAFPQSRNRALDASFSADAIPKNTLLRIVRAEDERRWDGDLRSLLSDRNAAVRKRAALAAGRIGNETSVADLVVLFRQDRERDVREMAAFALGEVESALGADALLATLKESEDPPLRARAIEALGKIAAALPKEQEVRSRELGGVILEALSLEGSRRSAADELMVLLGLTAVLRAKPANAGPVVARFSHYSDPRIRADVGNTLARLKLKDENVYLRKLLLTDPDPVVRANAARVLGATEDKSSFEALLNRALKDQDSRVRVSAIRALASLRDAPATVPLLQRGATLLLAATSEAKDTPRVHQGEVNELLEIASALGRLRQNSNDSRTYQWLLEIRPVTGIAPEVEIALARISPGNYLSGVLTPAQESMLTDWRAASSFAQALGEMAALAPGSRQNLAPGSKENNEIRGDAQKILRAMLDYRNSGLTINTLVAVHSEYAVPDVLRAFAAFKPKDLSEVLRQHLKESDVIIRATAAELLGELPLDSTNTEVLRDALKVALQDKELNDAALAIIDALAKQKNRNANLAMMPALDSSDHLIRRKAVASLRTTGAGDFSARIGTVQTRNTTADYERAIARIGKSVQAVVLTSKGSFTIELLPEEAPLNVDNFVQLAKRGYFNGITFHRVVPNFVIQGGDPRGDGNGGPGYSIRCEINEVPYERGAVGMALSGKDTGGSQWFVTHAPQPHLDGGYTVFGNVVAGMSDVDNIVRGDVIRSISVRETSRRLPVRRR